MRRWPIRDALWHNEHARGHRSKQYRQVDGLKCHWRCQGKNKVSNQFAQGPPLKHDRCRLPDALVERCYDLEVDKGDLRRFYVTLVIRYAWAGLITCQDLWAWDHMLLSLRQRDHLRVPTGGWHIVCLTKATPYQWITWDISQSKRISLIKIREGRSAARTKLDNLILTIIYNNQL